jgi:hypothetical protein
MPSESVLDIENRRRFGPIKTDAGGAALSCNRLVAIQFLKLLGIVEDNEKYLSPDLSHRTG